MVKTFLTVRLVPVILVGTWPAISSYFDVLGTLQEALVVPLATIAIVAGAAGAFYANELLRRLDSVDGSIDELPDNIATALETYIGERRRVVRVTAAMAICASALGTGVLSAFTASPRVLGVLAAATLSTIVVLVGCLAAFDALRLDHKIDAFVLDIRKRVRFEKAGSSRRLSVVIPDGSPWAANKQVAR